MCFIFLFLINFINIHLVGHLASMTMNYSTIEKDEENKIETETGNQANYSMNEDVKVRNSLMSVYLCLCVGKKEKRNKDTLSKEYESKETHPLQSSAEVVPIIRRITAIDGSMITKKR